MLNTLRADVAAALSNDPAARTKAEVLLTYPGLPDASRRPDVGEWSDPPLLVPFRLAVGDVEVSLFTTLTTFGTPRDVTLDELAVELFFPADDASEQILRAAG